MIARFVISAALILAFLPGVAAAEPGGDATAGGVLFKQRCMACHVIGAGQQGEIAPNLRGVIGRKAAATAFAYSAALKASGLVWTKAELDSFLAAPMKKVPGTRMVIGIADPQQRASVIAYLATLK